jgi:plasmid stabilization system protein ParE
VTYRIAALARRQAVTILRKSLQRHGPDAARRYGALIVAAMEAAARDPLLIGSAAIPSLENIRAYPIRFSRAKIAVQDRVQSPRHVIVYRVDAEIVEIICVVHDRMLLLPAVRRAITRRDP